MATSMETIQGPADLANTDNPISNEDNSSSFFCRHCQSAYSQPKILKCLHSFCVQCLSDSDALVKADDKKTVVCPLCSYPTDVPSGGVRDLTDNSFLERVSREYVKEVKNNLASKSLDTKEDNTSSNILSAVISNAPGTIKNGRQQELFINLTDEEKSESSKQHIFTEGVADSGGESGAVAAIQNSRRMQAKIMGLQEEALRVTYAIDRANHHRIEWLQHKEDLRRAIQRRSAQFQMLVKKMERQLVSQIEDKSAEDKFYKSLDHGKMELRKNLKQVLHGVSVIKSVREMGNYSEINELSPSLLSPSVGVNEVVLSKISYQLDLPKKSIEEMVSVGFGDLVKTTEERSIYLPEMKDFTNLKMEEISIEEEKSHSIAFNNYATRSAISGDSRAKVAGLRRSASTAGRATQRRSSDVGRTGVLEEFQSARESLRNRRQEILRQGQTSRDFASWRPEARRLSRPTSRRGRAQSLERSSSATEKHRTLFNLDAKEVLLKQEYTEYEDTRGFMDSVDDKYEDVTLPSPILEETSTMSSPKKKGSLEVNLSDISSAKREREPMSPIESVASEKLSFQELLQFDASAASLSSSTSSSRRVSVDRSPSMSPTMENISSNRESSRQLRRAINSAADKKSKIEFLRENWQKRKEILIQNQGFVSSEDNSSSKPDNKNVSSDGAGKSDNSSHTQIPLASRGIGSPSLRSKFTSVKRTQKQQKHQEEASEPSVGVHGLHGVHGETSRNVKRYVLPVSLLEEQIKQLEMSRESSVEGISSIEQSNSSDAPDGALASTSREDQEEEEEEVTVVETETIEIPVTGELLQALKTAEQSQIIPSSGQSKSHASTNLQNKDESSDEEKETVIEETVIVKIPDVSQSQMVLESQAPVTTRTHNATQISPTAGRFSWRTSSPSSQSVDSVSKSATLISSPVITASPATTTNRASDRFSTKVDNEADSEPSTTSLTKSVQNIPQTSSLYHREHALTSNTSLHTRPESQLTQTVSTTTSAVSSLVTTTTNTTKTTAATTSASSTSTTSATAGRYSSRYAPKVESVDISALFANFYKPPPTATSYTPPAKIKTEDNKENVENYGANNASKQTNKDKTDITHIQQTSNRYSAQTPLDTKDPSDKNKEDVPISKSHNDTSNISGVGGRNPTRSLFQRNYYTPVTQEDNQSISTGTSITDKTTNVKDMNKTAQQDAIDDKDITNTTSSISTHQSTHLRHRSSLYSKYYSNPNAALYLKPPETNTQTHQKEELHRHHHQSSQDQKVDETFTQAESSRRLYDPATPTSTHSRRHTVEIGKTIPKGVKISDLYKTTDYSVGENGNETSSQPIKTIHESTESENETVSRGLQFNQRPNLFPSRSFSSSILSQSKTEDQGSPRNTRREVKRSVTFATGQSILASPASLSTASSPASSPMTEDKKSIMSDQSDDSGSTASTSNDRNLKDIARKKRERWRRLTVY